MDGKRDILEEIARLPETERVNERLIDDIVAPQNKAKTPRGGALAIPRPALLGAFAVFAVLLAVLFFCVSLPAANRKPAAPPAGGNRYFDTAEISVVSIETPLTAFIEENALAVRYLTGLQDVNKAAYTLEEGQLVYLTQQCLFLSAAGFDTVNLGIVLTEDTFQYFEAFDDIHENIVLNGLDVVCGQTVIKNQYNIKAKFAYEDITYFLEIVTDSAEGKLEYYVNTLLGL